jgi:hypothetical protein
MSLKASWMAAPASLIFAESPDGQASLPKSSAASMNVSHASARDSSSG